MSRETGEESSISLPKVGCALLTAAAFCAGTATVCGGIGLAIKNAMSDEVVIPPTPPAPVVPPMTTSEMYSEICANGVKGRWVPVAPGANANLPGSAAEGDAFPYTVADMSGLAGQEVDLIVKTPKTAERVSMNNVPGECLNGQAPRTIAAELPVAMGHVVVTAPDGTSTEYGFTPYEKMIIKGTIRERDTTQMGDLQVTADGNPWMHCTTPVKTGCSEDVQAMKEAIAARDAKVGQ